MSINTRRGLALLLVVVALGAGVASGFGVLARGDGSTATATSIRGESYEYVTNGVYAYNAQRVVAEGVGWDIFTLFVVVPGLVAAAWLVARGSLKGRLFALGLLAYTFYQYLMYAMTWALGPLFPLWIALYAVSLAGIVWLVANVSVAELARCVTPRFPARGMAVFSGLMGLALVGMWSQRIAAGLGGDYETAMLLGQSTMVVQALDLGLVVPLCVFTALTAWARRPVGYLLASVVAVKGVTMSGAILAMLISAWIVEGRADVFGFAMFGTAFVATVWLAWRTYTSVTEPGQLSEGHPAPGEDAGRTASGMAGVAPAR